ncbi:MAG: hypothetical protein ABFS35_03955 [Bacteroidota bacterium]
MILVKNKIWWIIVLVFVFIPVKKYAQESKGIQYKFTETDSTYSFLGSFKTRAEPGCLLEMCFNYEHIRALGVFAKEVLLVDEGSGWNQIAYHYQKFIIFENKSVWHRKLNEEKQRVDFTMVSSKNSHSVMPCMVSSSGFYQVRQQGTCQIVEYYQECQLTTAVITSLYIDIMKNEVIKFMYRFSDYADTHCN